ncbi:outer membrane lipoprotein LolB [Massilia sp. PAMC28688]|uniref:outer membrane lipoprotein LolB n=1 Tax=Massilia sp. PAMC28688 TaxID=2861283 RepID=UPI001C638802|nr:outer membrane lipoprotein LolB [Massilia sp. PAMC28688]QYF94766.1 outer membrane lipoprotein LolB [Massilia sp. PAMC28688]
MKNTKLLCNVVLASACAFLSACATTPATPPSEATVAAYRDVIELAGRLSVNYDKDGRQETLSGKFTWNQRAGDVDVELISPLGQTIATIAVTPLSATLTQSGKAPRTARDIDSLTAQTLGWSLPVSGLRDWLQGYAVAADGQRYAASPANNTVTTRDGWRLTFVNWQEGMAGQPVPRRIDAQRVATAGVSELALRIVIDQPG